MSEFTTSRYEQEWHHARRPVEHGEHHETASSLYDPTLLGRRQITGRGNRPLHAWLVTRMQQTYGNRAVQRSVHARSGGPYAPLRPVQREDLRSFAEDDSQVSMDEYWDMSSMGEDGGVCYPEEDALFTPLEETIAPTGPEQSVSPSVPQVPARPGPNPTAQQMMEYQEQMEKYNLLMSIITQKAQMQQDATKSIFQKMGVR